MNESYVSTTTGTFSANGNNGNYTVTWYGPDDDGSAGVREPRRPLPDTPSGSMALSLS